MPMYVENNPSVDNVLLNARSRSEQVICLPISAEMSEFDVERVVDIIRNLVTAEDGAGRT